jgi:malate dehydrogenase
MTKSYPKVTIVGAGNVGATTALLLLMKDIANVVLIDVAEGVARGKALDLMHMRSNEYFGPTIIGTGSYDDTAASDLVVVTAGVPRRPGMTREDLLGVNAGIVRSVLAGALPASPDALYLFVTNPLDIMTNLAAALAELPASRLMGMGGVLDTARFVYAIAEVTGAEPEEIEALVIGAHGEGMVPLPSLARVGEQPLTRILDSEETARRIVQATVQGGAEVVALLETGSAFYAPASSIVRMVEALLGNTGAMLSTCARLEGEYGISGVSLCVPAILGAQGVRKIVELPLSADELAQLRASAKSVQASVEALIS